MKSGYSRATVNANIAGLQKSGVDRNNAIYTAASYARKCYFQQYPEGALPLWLAFPKSARLQNAYSLEGFPRNVQDNPRPACPDSAALAQAKRLYTGFTGKAPRTLKKLAIPPLPKAGLAIGRVFGIMYSVDATGERFRHEFKGSSRPTLIVGSDGKQVFLRGGAYTFTKRGFVDHK